LPRGVDLEQQLTLRKASLTGDGQWKAFVLEDLEEETTVLEHISLADVDLRENSTR
jgi:hypothetical protein